MSGGAEMMAGAVVQRVAGMLGQAAWQRVELLWTFSDDVEEMKDKLVAVQAVLVDAEKRSRGSEGAPVQVWLKKLKSAAYNIEDTLDELEANTMIWRSRTCLVKLVFTSFNPLMTRLTVSNKMRQIRGKLDQIAEEQKKFNFLQLADRRQAMTISNQETYVGRSDKVEMVGRETEKNSILNFLSQKVDQLKIAIIPIVGFGGMGKTTLAKSVFIAKETDRFDVKAWVHVSEEFDLKKIAAAIISQVEGSSQANDTRLQNLNSGLERILSGKIYFIVLDNLWEKRGDNLEKLMEMLQYGNNGSKIIVTTRSDQVAAALSRIRPSQFHTVPKTKLGLLSSDDCWSIMNVPSLGSGQDVELVEAGKECAKKCGGVPLAAKSLGHLMNKNCTREEWLKIRDSNILEIKEDDYGIMSGLMLSYHHMPPHLKLCFMYCSVFPKSHNIDHDSLIQQWIALGFIQDARGIPLQRIGGECINDFLGMSFLTLSTTPEAIDSGRFKPTLKFHMHDMVHDLAVYVASDEFSYVNTKVHNNKNDNRNCHYQLLMNHNEASSACKFFPTKVRALHFRGCDKMHLPKQAFSHTLCLRVLDLSGCHMSELPSSIYKLKLLRYLDASNLPISTLPKSLNRLLNFQTLILSNTSLKTLPTNIGCLQRLQYFDLSGCVSLSELPISFGSLRALLFLNLASCHELHAIPKSFGHLRSLQFLSLSDCYKLHSLPESCCQLHDLTHLDLSDCHNIGKLPDCIGNLSKLEYLNMTSCSKVQMLPESLCKLMMLKHLNLSFCIKLKHLPSCIGVLRLQSLDLQGCVFLSDLPDSIFKMSSLQNVEGELSKAYFEVEKLKKSLKLQGSYELDGGRRIDLWSQIVNLENKLCRELVINGLDNVMHLEGAKQAKLSNNSKLTKLALVWEHNQGSPVEHADATADISVLEKLVPPRSLQHLTLRGYMSIAFPSWMLDIASYLPHLTNVVLATLMRCSRLPPLGRLPNLRALTIGEMPSIKKIDREFYGDHGICHKLRVILLFSMGNLEEWWTTRSSNEDAEFLIPNLHLLGVSDCPKLKFLPYPPMSLTWDLKNSDRVLPEHGFGSLSSTTSPFALGFSSSSPSSEVWRRARYLSTIEYLRLNTTGLGTLPQAIQCFTSLHILEMDSCHDLVTLPEWLGDLTSLTEICITACPKLSSLPASIRRLTELKKLEIINCPTLSEKCQGEDRHKIAHIPHVKFQ
ncbi:disease resistance protein RGA2-like [Phragmites australis]|uniref:disease resistance protein RGA2-like n=1 Tax=Phragmites australis TaxID=29695 RepID=UPI002D77DC24|nr:disease resistance protein RGA2-like [Phragmites australis]